MSRPVAALVIVGCLGAAVALAAPAELPLGVDDASLNELRSPARRQAPASKPTPWGGPSSGAASAPDGGVAEWAQNRLAVKGVSPDDPTAASPRGENPFRRLAGEASRLPAGNPLRREEAPPTLAAPDRPALPSTDNPLAQAAFAERGPTPTAADRAPIRVGATAPEPPPLIPDEPQASEAADPPVRALESAAAPAAFEAPPGAAPAATWTDSPEPVRVASAAPLHDPGAGVGQPGPAVLEGPQEASLVVQKRGPAEAQIGKPCRFLIRVRNNSAAAAKNVVLRDEVPAGARLEGSTPTADANGGRLTWRLGDLAPGEDRTVEVRLTPLREGSIGSVATVSMDTAASASTSVTRPQLTMNASAGSSVRVGDRHTVTIELHNPGTGTATGVMLIGDLPAQVSHPAGAALEFEVGALAAGETRRIDLELTAEQAGRVASRLAAIADGDLRAERAVEFQVVAPSLAVSINGPKRRYLERPASYTIGIDNPGTAPAKDVRLVTHLPRSMEFVRANNLGEYDAQTHSVYWSLAELPDGQRGEVEVVAVPTASGEQVLRVESQAADGLRAETTQPVVVDGVASLAFEVRDLADPIEVGGDTTYEIRVLNEGTKAATGVRVTVEAPRGMTMKAAQGEANHRLASDQVEFAPLATLEPGEKVAYRVSVTATAAGDQRVVVSVESDDLSSPIRREESTRVLGDE